MENQDNNLNTNSRDVSKSKSDNTSLLSDTINTLITKLKNRQYRDRVERNNLILDLIRLRHPISKYELAKITDFSYPTIKRITKEFEFCDLVIVKTSIGENGMPVQLLSIPKSDTGEKK